MRQFLIPILALGLAITLVNGQTQTVVDPDGDGTDSIVEVITTNALGLATTQILQSIPGGAATTNTNTNTRTRTTATTALTTATTPATTLQQGGGVVGQPAATTNNGDPHGPTPYTYTTVIAGVTQSVVAEFTPSFSTNLAAQTSRASTGTLLGYSQWLGQFGSTQSASSAGRSVDGLSRGWWVGILTTVIGMGVGAAVVI